MTSESDLLSAVLRSLRQQHGQPLPARELAEVIWLARHLQGIAADPTAGHRPGKDVGSRKPEPDPLPVKPLPEVTRPPAVPDPPPNPFGNCLPTFFPPAPPPPAPAPSPAGLLPDQALPQDSDVAALLPVSVHDVPLLQNPIAMQRAVQALGRLEPDAANRALRPQLDEVETVEAYARTLRLWPQYRSLREPRLSLLLLLDGGLSMQVWHRLAQELSTVLMRSDAFRDVRLIGLDPDRPEAALGAFGGGEEEQLVLLISDCSGHHWWHGGAMHHLLGRLTRRSPVAILQLLPSWMWRRTALGIGEMVAVRNHIPLARNSAYRIDRLQRWDAPPGRAEGRPVLPVISLEATSLAAWSRAVLGQGGEATTAVLLPSRWPEIQIAAADSAGPADASAEARGRLQKFFQRSSSTSERLLRVMAAAPVLTLPVIRLLQAAMVPGGGPLAMAEVLLSWLIRRQDTGADLSVGKAALRSADRIQFRFDTGIRDALLDNLSGPDTADVLQRVSELVEQRWDQLDDVPPFQAYLADPSLLAEDHPMASMAAFATITADIIQRLPGEAYQQYASKLRQGVGLEPPDPFPANQFSFEAIDCETARILRLPEVSNFSFVAARFVDIKLDSFSFQTATIKQSKITDTSGTAWGYREWMSQGGSEAILLEMLQIPTGSFLMGTPENEPERYREEGPQHQVHLQDFFLCRTPITQAQWRLVANWSQREGEPAWKAELDPDPVARLSDASRFLGDQRPVVNVNWHDAMEFCRRLRQRTGKCYTLPSEAQWEYACRAGTTTPFHFGETITRELANYDGNYPYGDGPKGVYREQTTDVGSFPANAWGLNDMHGNVWEWCADQWHETYAIDDRKAPEDGSAWIDDEADEEQSRLLRGGSWYDGPRICRSAYRLRTHPDNRSDYVGFRVCCLPQDFLLTS